MAYSMKFKSHLICIFTFHIEQLPFSWNRSLISKKNMRDKYFKNGDGINYSRNVWVKVERKEK